MSKRGGFIRRVLLAALLVTVGASAAPSTALAVPTTLQLVLVGGGSVDFTPDPLPSMDQDACAGSPVASGREELSDCTLTYEAGTTVTLTATGDPPDGFGDATSLGRWSDARCSAPNPCTLAVGAEPETVAALFTPQRVSAAVVGGGTLTAEYGGVTQTLQDGCSGPPADVACTDVPLGAVVTMSAAPTTAGDPVTWAPKADGADLPFCDEPSPPPCHVTADRPRWVSVAFGAGAEPETSAIPPEVLVHFRVRKAGTGSGTVRSPGIDCGGDCADDRKFGDTQTLVAEPDSGARFDRWAGACGSSPRCSLAFGPVTALTAVFERLAPGPTPGGPGGGPSGNRPLRARVVRLVVRGHGRKRTVLIRLEVNAPSSVRGTLLKGRHRVTTRRWRVAAGTPLLRLRVPRRTRPGVYRVRLSIRGAGQVRQLSQRVRIRR
jgi:hypothetical protein